MRVATLAVWLGAAGLAAGWGRRRPARFDRDSFDLDLGVYGPQASRCAGTFVYRRPEKPHGWNGGTTNAELRRRIVAAVRP